MKNLMSLTMIVVLALVSGALADTTWTIDIQADNPLEASNMIKGGVYETYRYPDQSIVQIKGYSSSNNYHRKGYLRFDLSEVTESLATAYDVQLNWVSNVASDPVTMYFFALPDTDGTSGNPDNAPDDGGWTELDLSWSTAPGNNTTGYNFIAPAVQLGFVYVALEANTAYSFSSQELTDLIHNDSNGLITIMVGATGSISADFFGMDGSYPGIELEFTTSADPTTCQEVFQNGFGLSADLNEDCYVEWADFGVFASQWQMCNNPGDADCQANW